MAAWALLRLECLVLRVRQVRKILGIGRLNKDGYVFQSGSACIRVMAGSLATVLICDDEPSLRELIRVSLVGPYRFAEADDGDESLVIARPLRPDVVILDMMMPRRNGPEVLAELRPHEPPRGKAAILPTARPTTR